MYPFSFTKATDENSALESGASGARYIAGGTTLVDLMRETVERPEAVIDINALPYRDIDLQPTRLRVGSLVRMSELAAHPGVRQQFPVIVQALELSASAQLRNMASIGGNLMQRPRCLYFRDVSAACNRRTPGAGCAAIGGRNRTHAIFGTSEHCVATHPSDLAVALVALDAMVITRDSDGEHPIRISEFFRQPGTTPDQEHNLRPGQLIVAVEVPVRPESRRSGRISAIIHEGRTENSRYERYEDNIVGPPRFMYSSPNMRSTYRTVPLDINPPTYMRGPGTTTAAFALECAMDDLAVRLGMDPIELRLRNEPDRDQFENVPFSTRRLTDCFRQGANAFGWSRRNPTPRATRDGNALIGIGTAATVYHTIRSQCAVFARINADGTADVESAASDMGPGTYTSVTQVAADTLGLPIARVRFALGDSRMPEAPVHGGSQTMASVGSAVAHVGSLLRDRFIRTAVVDPGSPLNGVRPEDVSVADGRMFRNGEPARGESYQDLLRRRRWGSLDAQETWSPDDADQRFSMHAYGAIFAEVAVDELLGTVRIRRVYGSYDAGRIINPKLAHSQAIGGMVGGIGMALLEGTHLDHRDGRIVNANMSDYLVPVNADVPALDATFLPAEDTIADPLGVKGLGELVMVGVPAAIANAVFNATGRRVTDLPITIERLL